MAEVILEQVRKCYRGGIVAVDDCNIHVADGSCTVIVGPSGCGKTTLLRLIAGLESPDSGTIRIHGQRVNELSPHCRDLAMVFQDFALYPHLTVRRNLALPLQLRKTPRDEIDLRVAEAARMLGITGLLDRKPSTLSGGERQRAAVGRVLVRQPACALYDEPFSNLDVSLRNQLRRDLKLAQQRLKTTSVYVTHDQEEAMSLGDQLVVMAHGRVQQVGTPLDVYRHPANRFVASFIGNPPMTFLRGRISATEVETTFQSESGLDLPLRQSLTAKAGEAVVIGIRPTALSRAEHGQSFSMTVQAVEPLGRMFNVLGTTLCGTSVTAQMVEPASIGQLVSLQVDASQIHVFEPGDFGCALA